MSAVAVRSGSSRILLVEDNPGDADLTSERIADVAVAPYELRLATSLSDAVHTLSAFTADAIILDLNLPDSVGLETLARIKRSAGSAAIIVVSGFIDEELRSRALEDGAEEVFSKDDAGSRLFARSVLYVIERNIERNSAREQHRELERLLDSNPDAILVVNPDAGVLYVNRAAVALFGKGRGELLGTSLPFALDGDGTVEVSVRRPDGERLCELRAVATTWQREPATLAAIRDISERKNTEAMREAVRLKAEFLANMSHELRTPLNAIIGFSELLAEPAVNADAEKRTTYIGHVLTSARHLVRLINDVLDLAKVDAGKLVFIAEQTRLDMIMREVADSLGSLAAQAGAEIVVTADDTANDVYLDPVRLKQVLYNYLSNALKVAPKGTRVVVRSLPDRDGRVRIEVEDAGAGIPPDQLPRLFGEFQQLTTGSTTAHQGTGLGLSLTKRIVEAQGGTVGVASVVGKGSTFFAVLPRRATSAAPN